MTASQPLTASHDYDYGETDDGQPYIVMELVKGTTLSELSELTFATGVINLEPL